jgi:deoxycytidylate deaminase
MAIRKRGAVSQERNATNEADHPTRQAGSPPAGNTPKQAERPALNIEALAGRIAPQSSSEVIFGLVGPLGADLAAVATTLAEVLQIEVDYVAEHIRLSRLLDSIPWLSPLSVSATTEDRYTHYMNAGNKFRRRLKALDAMANLAIASIRDVRAAMMAQQPPKLRRAFVLHSLKRKEEVELLREVYGPAFVLVGAYAPRQERVRNLAMRIADSHYQYRERDFLAAAEQLVSRDERERTEPFGQNVEETFPEADIFVDATNAQRLRLELERFIRLLFGHPFHTPTRDEQGMFLAKTAALRSAALGRQVGSAITTAEGDVLVIGTNEVARGLGGLYWEGDTPDGRDFIQQHDVSDRHKRAVVGDALTRLGAAGWLAADYRGMDVPQLVRRALGEVQQAGGPLKGSRMMDIIEFMRPVHAEMAALTEAARRGVSVGGQTLYVTTFPCHECARHLVSSGLKRVVYVDPYPKSMATQLYADAIVVEGEGSTAGRTRFEPFLGIAPRSYFGLFELRSDRKKKDGTINRWVGKRASLKAPGDFGAYFPREVSTIGHFTRHVKQIAGSVRSKKK